MTTFWGWMRVQRAKLKSWLVNNGAHGPCGNAGLKPSFIHSAIYDKHGLAACWICQEDDHFRTFSEAQEKLHYGFKQRVRQSGCYISCTFVTKSSLYHLYWWVLRAVFSKYGHFVKSTRWAGLTAFIESVRRLWPRSLGDGSDQWTMCTTMPQISRQLLNQRAWKKLAIAHLLFFHEFIVKNRASKCQNVIDIRELWNWACQMVTGAGGL